MALHLNKVAQEYNIISTDWCHLINCLGSGEAKRRGKLYTAVFIIMIRGFKAEQNKSRQKDKTLAIIVSNLRSNAVTNYVMIVL